MTSGTLPTAWHVDDVLAADDEWQGLVQEAASAAGVAPPGDSAPALFLADPPPLSIVKDLGPAPTDLERIEAYRDGMVRPEVDDGRCDPRRPVRAAIEGVREREAIYTTSSAVDVGAREMRLTCQIGQYRSNGGDHFCFVPRNESPRGRFNLASATLLARVPAAELHGASRGTAVATVYVPVALDNSIQRISRLAVPTADQRRDASLPHFAVVGLRGFISVTVGGVGYGTVSGKRHFLSRTLSAHAPDNCWGFGPLRGSHSVEVGVPEIVTGRELWMTVQVSVLSLLAGDPTNYHRDAPFYAGIDFGGQGTAKLPSAGCGGFEIPVTPLIENQPITVPEVSFTGCW